MDIGVEQRRLAIEAIATLTNLKQNLVDYIFKPAGVPSEIYRPLLRQRNPNTGYELSKREMAPLILDALERRPDGANIIRKITQIAANWNHFHSALLCRKHEI
jgi:hypothetical protein